MEPSQRHSLRGIRGDAAGPRATSSWSQRIRLDQSLRALVHDCPLGVVLLEDDRVLRANTAACFLFGWEDDPADRGFRSILDVDANRAKGTLIGAIRLASSGSVPSIFRWRFRRPDDTVWDAEVSLSAHPRADRMLSMLVIRELEGRRMVQADLRRSQRLELLGQLSGGIAHDFNNLLTAIKGHLDLAIDRAGADEQLQHSLDVVRSCSRRAGALTRRLLDFGRARTVELEPVRLGALVEDMTSFLRHLVRADVHLNVEVVGEVAPVRADADQLEQAIMNLALNAESAMPHGGRLTIRAENQIVDDAFVRRHTWARPGSYVRLEIRDTGVGIPLDTQPRIFEPFFSARPKRDGTGLGLSIVYGIVKQHRGFIGVESSPGEGSLFWILLPAGSEPPAVAPAESERERSTFSADAPCETEQATILVVEDEQVVRDLAVIALEARGYRVLSAGSAEDAEALFAERGAEVDLLLTDLMLSGSNGRDLARRLVQARPGLRVIYTSGYDAERADLGAEPQGSSRFLEKPYSLRDLGQVVRELLVDRGPRAPD